MRASAWHKAAIACLPVQFLRVRAECSPARYQRFAEVERTAAISTKPANAIAEAAMAWGQNDDITVVTMRRTYAA